MRQVTGKLEERLFVMSHGDVIVQSTLGDQIFPTQNTGVLKQTRVMDTFNVVPSGNPAREPFQTNFT